MSNQVIVDLFVEDRAHESFLEPLLMRIAREQDIAIEIRVRSARGGHYKQILMTAIREAGHPTTLGGVDFAFELIEGMDLYRAGGNGSSLNAFLRALRAMLRQIARNRDEMG